MYRKKIERTHTHHSLTRENTQYDFINGANCRCVARRLRHDIVDGDTTATTHRSKKNDKKDDSSSGAHDKLMFSAY